MVHAMVLSHVYSPYLGRYVLSLVPQVGYMAAVPRTVEATPLVAKGSIETCSFPDSAEVGVDKPWSAKVHNVGGAGRLGLGIGNASGNPGSIVLTWQGNTYTIDPGNYLRIATVGEVPYCTRIDTSGQIAFQTEGSYTLRILGLHLDGATWYYDDERQITVAVSKPPASWPVTKQIHIFGNEKIAPGFWAEGGLDKNVGSVDTTKILGGRIDYTLNYEKVGDRVLVRIYWNDKELEGFWAAPEDQGKSESRSVNIPVTKIRATNTVKITVLQRLGGFTVVFCDMYVTLGYSEEPATDPEAQEPPWWESWWETAPLLEKALVGGAALGALYIIVKRPAMPTIITVPTPVLRTKEGE